MVIVIQCGESLNGDCTDKWNVFDDNRLVHFVLIETGFFFERDVVVSGAVVSSNRRGEPNRSGVRKVRANHIGFDCGAIWTRSIGPVVQLGFETP